MTVPSSHPGRATVVQRRVAPSPRWPRFGPLAALLIGGGIVAAWGPDADATRADPTRTAAPAGPVEAALPPAERTRAPRIPQRPPASEPPPSASTTAVAALAMPGLAPAAG